MAALWNVEAEQITEKKVPHWPAVMRRSMKRCSWCGVSFTKHKTRRTIDHIIAKSQGGKNEGENVRVSCQFCNEGRATVDHCIVTYVCIRAVVGPSLSAIARYYAASAKALLLAEIVLRNKTT